MVGFLILGAAGCGSSETFPVGVAATGDPLFAELCASCHGFSGEGDDTRGAPAIAGLSSAASIQGTVRNGSGDMPKFAQSVVSSQELADIIAYIATL